MQENAIAEAQGLPQLMDMLTNVVVTLDAVGADSYSDVFLYVAGCRDGRPMGELSLERGDMWISTHADHRPTPGYVRANDVADRRALLLADLVYLMWHWRWDSAEAARVLGVGEQILGHWIGQAIEDGGDGIPPIVAQRARRLIPPSWATLSRCIAHALWPKDMTAYPGLDWSQHGKWDWAYTDRGMDFISHPARRSAQLLHFEIANLPGFSPWLKGRIESLFKRFALQAYDYRDGLISWDLKEYDGRKNATVGYAEFRHDIVTWIAGDYHLHGHSGLDGQMAPNEFWQSQVDLNFGVTPVDSTGGLRRLLGVSVRRRVSHMGIRVHGLNYNGPGLGAIRDRHGSDVDWYEVRYDPYDLAGVDLLDHVTGEWLTLWCTRPDIANGTTAWQHTFHAQLAGEMARGRVVTEDGLERARAAAQADRDLIIGRGRQGRTKTAQVKLARYLEQGAFLTPIRLFPAPPQPVLPVVTGGTDSGGLITFSQPTPLLLPGSAAPVPALVDGSGSPLGGGAPRLTHQAAPALITTPAQKAAADVQARLAARRAERVAS